MCIVRLTSLPNFHLLVSFNDSDPQCENLIKRRIRKALLDEQVSFASHPAVSLLISPKLPVFFQLTRTFDEKICRKSLRNFSFVNMLLNRLHRKYNKTFEKSKTSDYSIFRPFHFFITSVIS